MMCVRLCAGFLALAALCLFAAQPARAAEWPNGSAPSLSDAAEKLLPGQYIWGPREVQNLAGWEEEGPVRLTVSLSLQRLYVWRGERLIGAASVSTGARGHSTPRGVFTILQKAAFHRSNIYSGAPMPYMQRLTWDGIALHAGHNPGHPASHGCIRLPYGFSRDLFRLTRLGVEVAIAEWPELRFWLPYDANVWAWNNADVVTGGGPHWLMAPRLPYEMRAVLYW